MAENSEVSTKTGKSNTRRTVSLTPEQALEILMDTLVKCRQSGVTLALTPLYTNGQQCVVVVLANCSLINGNITLQS